MRRLNLFRDSLEIEVPGPEIGSNQGIRVELRGIDAGTYDLRT